MDEDKETQVGGGHAMAVDKEVLSVLSKLSREKHHAREQTEPIICSRSPIPRYVHLRSTVTDS